MKTKLAKKTFESSTGETIELYRVIQGNLVLVSTRDYDYAKEAFEDLRRPPSSTVDADEVVLEEFDA